MKRNIIFILLLFTACNLFSQSQVPVTIESTGNNLITANVVTQPNWGKFWLTTSQYYGNKKLLFQNGNTTTDDQLRIWSNIVFRTQIGGQTRYHCNVPTDGVYAQFRPLIYNTNTQVDYVPFDKVNKVGDKLEIVWNNIDGFQITMRFYPEKTNSPTDNGGDMIMEFDYKTSVPSASLGVFLMLDCYNEETLGIGGPYSLMSILTSNSYHETGVVGKLFPDPASIPEFYQVGNFKYQYLPNVNPRQFNNTFPVHKLKGKSFGGLSLTEPDTFAIGQWDKFVTSSWGLTNYQTDFDVIDDMATILKWVNLSGNGTIRTAFSASLKEINNFYVCRDDRSKLFADIRTVKNITQNSANAPFSPSVVDVEMYLANLSKTDTIKNGKVRLVTPIASLPANNGRLQHDGAYSPAMQIFNLAPNQVTKITWKLNLNTTSSDTIANLLFRYDIGAGEFAFQDDCSPSINIIPYHVVKNDTLAPVIKQTYKATTPKYLWDFDIYDRHTGYNEDSGIRSIQIAPNDNFNITPANVVGAPAPYKLCDTTTTVTLRAEVADSTKPASMVLCVTDCFGNIACDTLKYFPLLDTFAPVCVRIDSIGSADLTKFPSNSREYRVYLTDSIHKGNGGYDFGFGSVTNIGSDNFEAIEINFDRGNAGIKNFDKVVSFSAKVKDTSQLARISVKVQDFVGNFKIISLDYAPLPDVYAPLTDTILNPNGTSWTVNISDKRSFDRGLKNVVQLTNTNFNFVQPLIPAGSKDYTFQVSVTDPNTFGELELEIQDMYYDVRARGHADTVHFYFGGRGDTRKPIIQITPRPNSNPQLVQAEFDVEVRDVHIDNNITYPFDRGIRILEVLPAPATTPNFRVTEQITFNAGDKIVKFKVGVIDTLANSSIDSICIKAVDMAGNEEVSCYIFSLTPDLKSPYLVAEIKNDFSALEGKVFDNRIYDRGLGELTIESPVNLKISELPPDIEGAFQNDFKVSIVNPFKSTSGVLVLRDRIGKQDLSQSTQNIHATKIPFSLPAYNLYINTPQVVEGGSTFEVSISAMEDFKISNETKSIDFSLLSKGAKISFKQANNLLANISAVSNTPDSVGIRITAASGLVVRKGDILGKLVYKAEELVDVATSKLVVANNTALVNSGVGSVIKVEKIGDTAVSILKLPAPKLTVYFDSLIYINGSCQRVLQASPKNQSITVTQILGVKPNPVNSSKSVLELYVRNLDAATKAEFVDINGNVISVADIEKIVQHTSLNADENQISKGIVRVPKEVPTGVYYLHIQGTDGITKVIIQK